MALADLVRHALEELSARRPVFHSDADFQHELAMRIKYHDPTVSIRLERPARLRFHRVRGPSVAPPHFHS